MKYLFVHLGLNYKHEPSPHSVHISPEMYVQKSGTVHYLRQYKQNACLEFSWRVFFLNGAVEEKKVR